jgi:hypothetical protein
LVQEKEDLKVAVVSGRDDWGLVLSVLSFRGSVRKE